MDLTLNMSRVIGIYAPQKYGKTFLMHYLLELYLRNKKACFLYDTDMERNTTYSDLAGLHFVYSRRLSDMEDQQFFNDTILKLRAQYSNFVLAVEDIDKLLQSPVKSSETLEIYRLASDSRHQRIAVIYSTKTPSYIPTTLRLNTNLFFFGKFVEPDFVKWITTIVPKQTYAKIKKPEFVMLDVWTSNYAIVRYDLDRNTLVEVGI